MLKLFKRKQIRLKSELNCIGQKMYHLQFCNQYFWLKDSWKKYKISDEFLFPGTYIPRVYMLKTLLSNSASSCQISHVSSNLWSLIRVVFGESPPLSQVGTLLLIAGRRGAFFLAGGQDGVRVGLQTRPLVVWERHGEQRVGVAYELVDVPLPGNLGRANQRREKLMMH